MSRPPLPPFTRETALQKVRAAEDAWNTRDAARVSLAYTEDSRWRNRSEFVEGRAAIVAFLERKWMREHEYRLIKVCGRYAHAEQIGAKLDELLTLPKTHRMPNLLIVGKPTTARPPW